MAFEPIAGEEVDVVPKQERPRGYAKRWPGAKLDTLSKITPADIDAARERWRELAPSAFASLLDAKPSK